MRVTILALIAALTALPASAQTIGGITGKISNISDDIDSAINFEGGIEVEVMPQLSVGGTYASYSSDTLLDFSNITLRASYEISPMLTAGAYTVSETVDITDVGATGVEVAGGTESFGGEFYLASVGTDSIPANVDESMSGLMVEYRFMDRFSVGLDVDVFVRSDGTFTQTFSSSAYVGQFQVTENASAFARLGTTSLEEAINGTVVFDSAASFTEIGAQIDFGPKGGARFGKRSIFSSFGF